MTFGEILKKYREEKGLSQRALGELLGVKQQTIAQYEKLIDAPKTATVRKLADALGLTVADFVGEIYVDKLKNNIKHINQTPERIVNNIRKTKLLKHYDNLNELGQEEAVKRLREMTYTPEYRKEES